ncbi:NAD(P)-dependent oxidoreductase [Kitasatospora sp. NPDC057223]|uniref:NAD(P)-dependent oxidoreductase n=1 Tax=Kitasatospora sp. NPDC057223 TaxID=3346055 RepID=UPI00362F3DB6
MSRSPALSPAAPTAPAPSLSGTLSSVTVLGLGPMGRALAAALLRAGRPTTVWNRTPGKAAELVARGAVLAATAAEAVAASPLTLVCVLDYDAVHAVVGPAAEALRGRTLVNLTAGSPARARAAALRAAELGIDYLDGAIMVPVAAIGGPAALVLYSGPQAVYEAHRGALAQLGGTAVHLGADPGRAAGHEVALLDIFWTAMSGIVHGFALAAAEGVTAPDLLPYARGIGGLLPGIIDGFAGQIAAGRYPGEDSSLLSAATAMAHVLDAAAQHGLDTGVLTAAHALARRAVDAGHGGDGFARLAEVIGERAA